MVYEFWFIRYLHIKWLSISSEIKISDNNLHSQNKEMKAMLFYWQSAVLPLKWSLILSDIYDATFGLYKRNFGPFEGKMFSNYNKTRCTFTLRAYLYKHQMFCTITSWHCNCKYMYTYKKYTKKHIHVHWFHCFFWSVCYLYLYY
jgi:hypothetical protein